MSLSKLWPPHDHRLLQSILYTNAPFFCYPFKTFLNSKFGGNYAESYVSLTPTPNARKL